MVLTPIQYRDIMDEYDQLRRDNYMRNQRRTEEIYDRIPAIKKIDDDISSQSLALARQMIFSPQEEEKARLHRMIEEASYNKRVLLMSMGYPENYLDPIYSCPSCKDTGYVGGKKCSCLEAKILDYMYRQSNLKDAISENNFDHFNLAYYSDFIPEGEKLSPKDNMREILNECYQFIQNMAQGKGKNLMLYGSPGVGKTFLSNCIAAEVIKSGKSVIYYTSYQLFKLLADSTFNRVENPMDISTQILETDLLIIDDLGTELNNAFVNSQLFLCINERILSKRSTIISTNYTLKEINNTYSERISSRLIQFYTLLHVYGDDIRIKKLISSIDDE